MRGQALRLAVILTCAIFARPGDEKDNAAAVSQAMAQGDAFVAQKKFDKALDAYRKADKLSHHSCAVCLLRLFKVERSLGDLSAALDYAKKAATAAGENKTLAAQAHLVRGTLLGEMAGKPSDKKLREAEQEFREALTLDSRQVVAHYNLGVILLKQERDAEGIAELNTYIATPGADPKSAAEARRIIANPIRAREPFAPDFSFVTLEGASLSNSALQGKVILLDFWGTWCPPCRESVPMLLSLHKKYANRPFEMVGISSDDDEQAWKAFIAANHMAWPEYIDLSGRVQEQFQINSFPTYIVLDRQGIIRFRQSGVGMFTSGDLEEAINKALKKPFTPQATSTDIASAGSAPAAGLNSATAPAAKAETPSSAPASEVGQGTVSGNVYRNDFLELSYQFPKGWVPARPEILREANEKALAMMKATALQQHSALDSSTRIMAPEVIFYASSRGEGDGFRLAVPSVRITAVPWRSALLTLDDVQLSASSMERMGFSVVRAPEEFTAGDHQCFRVDFENKRQSPHSWVARIQTLVDEYLVTLEILATSQLELEQLTATAQSLSFTAP